MTTQSYLENEGQNRKLNSIEHSWEILNREVCTWFSSRVVKIKGRLNPEIISASLKVLQKLHPRLTSRIVGPIEHPHFESGDVTIPVILVEHGSLEKEIIKQINNRIDSSQALMRIVVISNKEWPEHCHLILLYHHSIGDGISVLMLLEELFIYYQKIEESQKFEVNPNLVELLPIEKFIPEATSKIVPSSLAAPHFDILPFEEQIPLNERRSNYILRSLSEDNTKKLIEASKRNKVSIQGILNAALVISLGKKIYQNNPESKPDTTVSCCVYVNLRPFLKNGPTKVTLNSFISAVTVYHKIPQQLTETDDTFWNMAQDSKRQIVEGLNEPAHLFTGFGSAREYVINALEAENEVDVSTAISNLKTDMGYDYGSIQLEDIYTVSPQGAFRYIHLYVSTFRDKMHISFCYSEPSHGQKLIDEIADDFITILTKSCL